MPLLYLDSYKACVKALDWLNTLDSEEASDLRELLTRLMDIIKELEKENAKLKMELARA